jgi:hypothetical protein
MKRTSGRRRCFITVVVGVDAGAGVVGSKIWLPLVGAVVGVDTWSKVRQGGVASSEMGGSKP